MKTDLLQPSQYYRPTHACELRREALRLRYAAWLIWGSLAACFWVPSILAVLLSWPVPIDLMKSLLSHMGVFAGWEHEMDLEAGEVVIAFLTYLLAPLPLLFLIVLPSHKAAAARQRRAEALEA